MRFEGAVSHQTGAHQTFVCPIPSSMYTLESPVPASVPRKIFIFPVGFPVEEGEYL